MFKLLSTLIGTFVEFFHAIIKIVTPRYNISLSGLTENDFELAKALDVIPVAYSPKWLKDNPARVEGAPQAAAEFRHMDYGGLLHDERVLP